MISLLKEFLKELKDSKEFKIFKDKNPLSYNTSASYIDNNWQIDFYNPETDKITSFIKKDNEILSQESEVFRKEKKEIPELKIEDIKIDLPQVEELMSKKYQDKPKNKIIILQQKEAPFWNITYLTTKIDIINTKIDAITGEIIDESVESGLSLIKK